MNKIVIVHLKISAIRFFSLWIIIVAIPLNSKPIMVASESKLATCQKFVFVSFAQLVK